MAIPGVITSQTGAKQFDINGGNIMGVISNLEGKQFEGTPMGDQIMAILSDKSIFKYNKQGLLVEQTLSDNQVQPNSVDLTLGNTWKKVLANTNHYGEDIIDPSIPMNYEKGTFDILDDGREYAIIRPNEFVLMASNEILNIPNGIVSFVCGRSSIARIGVQTEQAGFIDSGFRGTITLEIYNQNEYPVMLIAGMRVAQVYFIKAEKAERAYGKDRGSKYNDQIEATESRIHLDPEFKR